MLFLGLAQTVCASGAGMVVGVDGVCGEVGIVVEVAIVVRVLMRVRHDCCRNKRFWSLYDRPAWSLRLFSILGGGPEKRMLEQIMPKRQCRGGKSRSFPALPRRKFPCAYFGSQSTACTM